MTEKIVQGEEFTKGILSGVDKLANAVKDTLGPKGNTVILKNAFGEIVVTKDGVSVANEIELSDPVENLACELVKKVAAKANDLAGDGTTTATVLAQALLHIGMKAKNSGVDSNEFKQGLKMAKKDILDILTELTVDIKPDEDSSMLKSVALVSSNGDEEIAEMVSSIFKTLGKDGVVSVSHGNGINTTTNIVKGMQFDRGYLSPYSVTDPIKKRVVFENPFIYLYDGKLSDFNMLVPALNHAGGLGRPLVVIAEDVKESALRGLLTNHMSKNVMSVAIMSPGYGAKRLGRLEDMSFLFGGHVITQNDFSGGEFNVESLGEADKIEVSRLDTAIIGGRGNKKELNSRVEFLKEQLSLTGNNDYETTILEDRIGKLLSGVASISVGAMSNEEGKEILDRVEDCKNAVKAALQQGVVEGGGFALMRASLILKETKFNKDISEDVISGYRALVETIAAPFKQILTNAGGSPALVSRDCFGDDSSGYNTKTGKYVDSMLTEGIVDPVKVTKIAVESAVSIVGTLLTSNYAIINEQDATVANFG